MFFWFEPLEQFEIIKLILYRYTCLSDNSVFELLAHCVNVCLIDTLNSLIHMWNVLVSYIANFFSEYFNYVFPDKDFYNYIIEILSILPFKLLTGDQIAEALFSWKSVTFSFLLLVLAVVYLFLPVLNNLYIIPKNWQLLFENLYNFVVEMLYSQVGKNAQRFLPYIFSIFLFILLSNVLGMTLFAFTLTSHVMVTFTLGVSTFLGLTLLGLIIQKLHFFLLFFPQGIPLALLPMLIIIEIISYCSRALSLSIRLFANLMSGHTLLHILAFFSSKLFKYKFLIGILSFLLILAIVCLEFCIALLQAYVFAILICIYLNDSFQVAH